MKRPAFQFYPGDWLRDAHLRTCSLEARGLWIDMLALMHQAEPYGHLVFNGKPATPLTLSRMVGCTPRDAARLVKELDEAGVIGRDANGAIFSRRMVRDEALRNARAAGGPKGAEHGEKGGLFGPLGGRPKGGSKTPLDGGEDTPLGTPPYRAEVEEGVTSQNPDSKTTPFPSWIDSQLWVDFIAMRMKIRKPATERAKVLIVKELERLRAAGQNPNAVLEQSIRNAWQDVFPIREPGNGGDKRWPSGAPPLAWRPGAEPLSVLHEAAKQLGIAPAEEGETHGQFRRRIVDAGGEGLLKAPRAAA